MKKLTRNFYRKDGLTLAKELIGKVLIHKTEHGVIKGIITETEAYMGVIDKASHAYGGLRSNRTETMYHDGGTSYVYLIYGMYYCMNVVANKKDIPEAVLIRGVHPYDKASLKIMKELRKADKVKNLCNGPGKLCIAMDINKSLDDADMCASGTDFYIADAGIEINDACILKGPRINIDYAEEAASFPWRFYLSQSYINTISDI